MESYSKPTSKQVDAALPLLSSPQHEAHFFARLENPSWIAPLAQRNVFEYPPKAQPVEGGGIRFPRWGPSRYLARMASKAPREVADIFAKMETDNPSIIGDMLDAALAMPASVSVSLVPPVCRAAQKGMLWVYFKDASDLCVRLAQGGEFDGAVELAVSLFAPKSEEQEEGGRRRDEYWYKHALKKVIAVLAGPRARIFLPALCDWLRTLVRARLKRYGCEDAQSDHSYVWRPAIEEHEQNRDYTFGSVMVGFVREGFEQAIRSQSLLLDEALQIVERYPYTIFKRIRIHLIGEFADQNPHLSRQVMLDQALFYDYECKHEYATLVGKRFGVLTPAEQTQWLRWIHDGPMGIDAEALDDPDDPGLSEHRRSYWRFERLHWVRNYLTGEDERFYQEMLQEHGEPDMADLNVRVGPARFGDESPMSIDELAGMTFEQAVDAVSSWKPKGSRFEGPTVSGLASTFGQYVATNLIQLSGQARTLIDRPAPFVREFIKQMSEGVKAGRDIELRAVLDLCHWVVSRPIAERTTPKQEDEMLVDEDWQWSREDISALLENVSNAKSGHAPKYTLQDFRQPMWGLIEELCRDRAESYSVKDASESDPRACDYLGFGINSPRGKALKAALGYARWVANHVKQMEGERDVAPRGFEVMPEIREMLEWQIAPENRTFEALSVIGASLNLVYSIDRQWLMENAGRLFELEAIEQTPFAAQGWAAWNAFLVWVRPHIEYYRALKSQFAYAVEHATKVELPERSAEQPMYHLGEHLMLLHGRGQLGLDDDEGLLRRFLMNSSPDVRRHAIGFIGESLEGHEEVPSDVISRFMALWDFYWAGPGKEDAKEKPNAFLFALWFSCGRFPQQWAIDRLEQFVEVVPIPEPDHNIAANLAKTAHVDIAKSVRILDRMIRGDQEGWHIQGWLDFAKEILKEAMRISGEARERSLALIDYLGRRGYTDLGELLRQMPGTK